MLLCHDVVVSAVVVFLSQISTSEKFSLNCLRPKDWDVECGACFRRGWILDMAIWRHFSSLS